MRPPTTAEHDRLHRQASAGEDWGFFGPYLAERQWGTIREDYSEHGSCWDYFPHDHARSRAYRWGEDGLLGFCDREARLCFGLALWNGRDPILKERLFGLAAPEGNHGEDVKELYYYLDSTPTHSYCKALYKYPLRAYPYERLVREGRERDILDPEFEIEDAFHERVWVEIGINLNLKSAICSRVWSPRVIFLHCAGKRAERGVDLYGDGLSVPVSCWGRFPRFDL